MARKRMIDPAIWESEQVMSLDAEYFKLYIYLISHADDEGRLAINYMMIASRCFPMHNVTGKKIQDMIERMNEIQLVYLYGDNGHIYLAHPNWNRYQSINKPRPSNTPTVALPDDYGNTTVALPPNRIEENRIEKNRREAKISADAHTVILYLNDKSGSKFPEIDTNASMIDARIKEGYSVDDFKKAITWCVSEWTDDEKMDQYIRPATIFAKTKFPGYVENWARKKQRLEDE